VNGDKVGSFSKNNDALINQYLLLQRSI